MSEPDFMTNILDGRADLEDIGDLRRELITWQGSELSFTKYMAIQKSFDRLVLEIRRLQHSLKTKTK